MTVMAAKHMAASSVVRQGASDVPLFFVGNAILSTQGPQVGGIQAGVVKQLVTCCQAQSVPLNNRGGVLRLQIGADT